MPGLVPHIALVSESKFLSAPDLSTGSAAIQKQVTRDFGELWDMQATVDSFAALTDVPTDYWPVLVKDAINAPGALGYHTLQDGQPIAFVQYTGDDWARTASHEILEMLADPSGNRVVAGSAPVIPTGMTTDTALLAEITALDRVNYLLEVCDPCENQTYLSNQVSVSDFITPQYYGPSNVAGSRLSFQGTITQVHQVLDGGYISFGDSASGNWYQIFNLSGRYSIRALGVLSIRVTSLRSQSDASARAYRQSRQPLTTLSAAKAEISHSHACQQARAQRIYELQKSLTQS